MIDHVGGPAIKSRGVSGGGGVTPEHDFVAAFPIDSNFVTVLALTC